MGRISKVVKQNLTSYGSLYLLPRDQKWLITKLVGECEMFESAADKFYLENEALRKQVDDLKSQIEPQKINHNSLCETETYKVSNAENTTHDLTYALECIVWYYGHYEWLEPLADELDKATTYYSIPPDVRGTSTCKHFIWMLLVGMFGDWGTSIGGGWIEKTKECAEYIRALCAKAKGESEQE